MAASLVCSPRQGRKEAHHIDRSGNQREHWISSDENSKKHFTNMIRATRQRMTDADVSQLIHAIDTK